MEDMEILLRACKYENRTNIPKDLSNWNHYSVGASRADINRLIVEGLIEYTSKQHHFYKCRLTAKGQEVVRKATEGREYEHISKEAVLQAMDMIVGYQDIKDKISRAIEQKLKLHFLFQGQPACAKSIFLDCIRAAVEDSHLAFGSRTSAAGLSDILFERQPRILLMDEIDKMKNDVFDMLLGLMESGEVIETKSKKSRGIILDTMVICAGNYDKCFSKAFLSRFALHVHFPTYSRQEYIDVCISFLTRSEGCPHELARLIGEACFDERLGDVRQARSVWKLMDGPTESQLRSVIELKRTYSLNTENIKTGRKTQFKEQGILI